MGIFDERVAIDAPEGLSGAEFGKTVAVDGELVVVGPVGPYLYEKQPDGE